MSAIRWAVAAACCALTADAALSEKAARTDSKPAAIEAKPAARAHDSSRDSSWPKVLPTPSSSAPAATPAATESQAPAKPPLHWSAEEIALAQARCATLLKGIDAVTVPETPIRDGTQCGAAAPMKLISIGKNPPVQLSPPPVITCDLIAALSRWMDRDVQPLARKHLGAPVIKLEAMSSYSCRNAYGRADRRLSEHGRANALDISSFVTARGQSALVVADWGMTAREVAAQAAAAAKAQAEQAAAHASNRAAVGSFAAPQLNGSSGFATQSALVPVPASPPEHTPGQIFSIPGLSINIGGGQSGSSSELGLSPPSRLGGPKPVNGPPAASPALAVLPQVKTEFLRAAHRSACKIFGTVLGPEANKAHKNHFHVDMADRKAVICE